MTENEAIQQIKRIYVDTNEPDKCIALKMSISALVDIQSYRTIGTVEECREAMENRIPKKPVDYDNCGNKSCVTRCPSCFEPVFSEYCKECGKHIDWSKL